MARQTKDELVRQAIYEARMSEAANERFDDLAAEALGINRTDMRCLNIVHNEGGSITAGRVAELSGLTTAAVTTVLDRLEAKDYVRRARDETDRRRVLVELTPRFLERVETIWGPLGDDASGRVTGWSGEQLRAIAEWFRISRELNETHAERIRDLNFD